MENQTATVVEAFGSDPQVTETWHAPTQAGKFVTTGPTKTIKDGKLRIDVTPITENRVFRVPDEQVNRMMAGLPGEIRRTARQRFAELVRILYQDATRQFYQDGRIRWPKSIENELAVIGAAQGKGTIVAQVEDLARRYIVKGAREQQAQDAKRITTDWSGHLSA